MTTPELKRCPFCGSRSARFVADSDKAWNFGGCVECDSCGARSVGCYQIDKGDTPESMRAENERLAAAAWNART